MELLTVNEAAERIGVSRTTIYHGVRSGRLTFYELFGKRLFDTRDIDAFGEKVGSRNGYIKYRAASTEENK